MTPPERDREWWAEFEAAPPELQKAMNATIEARTGLQLVERFTDDKVKLLPHQRRLVDAEGHESQLREALLRSQRVERDQAAGQAVRPIDLDDL